MKSKIYWYRLLRVVLAVAPLAFLSAYGGGSGGSGGSAPPTVSGTINGQSRVVTNQLYNYSATATNGTPANYSWAWGDGTTDAATGSTGTRLKIWRAAGDYVATLALTDGTGGTAQASQPVNVVDRPISSGNEHSCAILFDNTVACWGNNIAGQIGDGTTLDKNVPTVVPGLSNVVSLAAYGYSTCAAKTDGSVWCWGFEGYAAQNIPAPYVLAPKQVSGLNDVVALAGGDNATGGGTHACALQRSGTVQCWGSNEVGQLGRGNAILNGNGRPSLLTPQPVAGLTDAVNISASGASTCAIRAAGSVLCWGYGGQNLVILGINQPSSTIFALSSPIAVVGVSNAVSIAQAPGGMTCAVINDGSIKCWGVNVVNVNGSPNAQTSTTLMGALPSTISGVNNVAALTLGLAHTCALKTDATVECWGTYGFRSNSSTAQSQPTSRSIKDSGGLPLTNVQALSSGLDHHTCASKFDGTVHCWGWNSSGQLGDGANVDHMAAKPVIMPKSGQLAAGTNHSCAFNVLGEVTCLGQGGAGQLGNGSSTDSPTPVPVNIPGGVSAISSAAYHTCAIKKSDANVACWGLGTDGQLGNGANTNSNIPVTVNIPGGAIAISAGSYHTCALKTNGDLACWGQNVFGQLGNGANINQNIPVTVTVAGGFTALSAGTFHTCALTAGATMKCWGRGAEGQLGNVSTNNFNTPQSVNIPGGVASISSTTFHTPCVRAIVADAAICWGIGVDGQLGNGTNTNINSPSTVVNLAGGIASISTGYHHACALKADGDVACWGKGDDGQLGNGTNNSSNVPITISIPGGVTSISAGYYHTCAFKSNGDVVCWGRGYGNTPTLVPGLGASVTFWK